MLLVLMLVLRRRRLSDDDGLSERLLLSTSFPSTISSSSWTSLKLHSLILLILTQPLHHRHRIAPRLPRHSMSTPSLHQTRSSRPLELLLCPLLLLLNFELLLSSKPSRSSCDGEKFPNCGRVVFLGGFGMRFGRGGRGERVDGCSEVVGDSDGGVEVVFFLFFDGE